MSPPFLLDLKQGGGCGQGRIPVNQTVEARVENLIEPSLTALGFDVVRVRFGQGILQIMAERRDEAPVTVEDCGRISHTVSALLDVAEPIKSRYMLEVSSPGLDRPLTRLADYERFAGTAAMVEMERPVDGRRKFSGLLRGAHGEVIRLEEEGEGGIRELPFAGIAQARLDRSRELVKKAPRSLKPSPKVLRQDSGKRQSGEKKTGEKKTEEVRTDSGARRRKP